MSHSTWKNPLRPDNWHPTLREALGLPPRPALCPVPIPICICPAADKVPEVVYWICPVHGKQERK